MSSTDNPHLHSFQAMIFSDLLRYRPGSKPSWFKVLTMLPFQPGLIASLFLRLQQVLYRRGLGKLAFATRSLCVALTGADFVPGADVGLGLFIAHPVGLCIGVGATLGDNVTLAGGVVLGVRDLEATEGGCATVGNDVFLGAHAVLIGDVKIGDNAMIGANTVVLSDVAENAIVMGVPAKNLGTRPAPGAATAASG